MEKTDKVSESDTDWPVTFDQVEQAQLRDMLRLTPAQRLAMAEELSRLAIAVQSAEPTKD